MSCSLRETCFESLLYNQLSGALLEAQGRHADACWACSGCALGVTTLGDISLENKASMLPSGWYGKEVWFIQTLTAVLWLEWRLSESTEIHVPRTRRLNLKSFGDFKTMFYTTLPFWNLMSFQRHLFAHQWFKTALLWAFLLMTYSGSKNCPNVWLFCKDWSRTNQEN